MSPVTPIHRSLLYYAIAYAYLYGTYFVLRHLSMEPTPLTVVATNAMSLIFLLLIAYYLSAPLRWERRFPELIGLRCRNALPSLFVSGAFITVPGLALIGVAAVTGLDLLGLLYGNASRLSIPWFSYVSGPALPLLAVAVWSISGLTWFSLLQAFPYEVMGGGRRLLSLIIVSLGFIGLYNLPLVTGEWKLDDIVMLGVAYPIAYALTRSSVGLIINYVFLFELPVASAVLKGLGDQAFWGFVALRLALGIACLVPAAAWLARRRLGCRSTV